MRVFLAVALAAFWALASTATAAQGDNGPAPVVLKMKPGTDRIVVRGVMKQGGGDCCAYAFKARAGQRLIWRETGASLRFVMTYPDGHAEGPGFANPLPLPADGTYTLSVSPDLMADGAFGRFTLTLTIPPAR